MEHNEFALNSLPQEIKELIFSFVPSATDLVRLRAVSTSTRATLASQRLWKQICLREFDLEFFDDNSNWIELAAKYGAINYNIRKARVLVQALAVNMINSGRIYTGESYLLEDDKIVVNWLRTHGHGSNSMDYSDHSAILNINTRKEEQTIRLENERSLIVIGGQLAQLDWNGYNVRPYYTNVLLSESHYEDAFKQSIPTGQATRTILSNSDPDQQHIVVIVELVQGQPVDIALNAYDLYEQRVVKTFSVKKFSSKNYYYDVPNVILHGERIYAWQSEENVLHVFSLSSGTDQAEQHKIAIEDLPKMSLLGVHKSYVFGYSNTGGYPSTSALWMYDLHSKKLLVNHETNLSKDVQQMTVHCGVLVVGSGQYMYFIDYRSDPNQLKLISTLQLDEVYRSSLQSTRDGKLFLSGYNSGAKLIDFEHANDSCEIVFLTRSADRTAELKFTKISIKAHELVSRAKELLSTHEYVSHYYKMNKERRFGIMYVKDQKRQGKSVKWSDPKKLSGKKLAYNTPYMYHKMTVGLNGTQQDKVRIVWTVSSAVNEYFGGVILFYEEFDGTRWKLSKPNTWNNDDFK